MLPFTACEEDVDEAAEESLDPAELILELFVDVTPFEVLLLLLAI